MPVPPDPLELALLQHAEQRDLGLDGQVADLVEEDGAAVGQLEATEAPLRRPGERALLVAEQLRRDELARNGRAIDADEGPRGARRSLVDRARDELLARAGLTGDQHGRIRRRDLGHVGEHRLQRRRRPDDLLEHRGPVHLVPQYQIFFVELILQRLKLRLGPLLVVDVDDQDRTSRTICALTVVERLARTE